MSSFSAFLEGIASLFGYHKTLDDYDFLRGTPEEVNERAIRSDWEAVGKDIQTVIDQLEKEKIMDDIGTYFFTVNDGPNGIREWYGVVPAENQELARLAIEKAAKQSQYQVDMNSLKLTPINTARRKAVFMGGKEM